MIDVEAQMPTPALNASASGELNTLFGGENACCVHVENRRCKLVLG